VRATRILTLTAAGAAMTALVAAGVWRLAPPVMAQSRPCTCDQKDLDDIQAKLDLTEKQLDAWKKVLDTIESDGLGHAISASGAAEEFCVRTGLPPTCMAPSKKDTSRAGSVNPDTGEPEVNPKYEAAHCDTVVNSVKHHERSHVKFFKLHRFDPSFWYYLAQWNSTGGARLMCWNELFAHQEHILYLKEKQLELERQCHPELSAYPTAEQKEEQKQRVAAAEKRVTAYAQAIG
jgi:hypothetical protein